MDDPQSTRVLVAGATGHLGRALLPVLHQRGKAVVALVRPGKETRLASLQSHLEAIVATEITTPEIPASIFRGVQTVISTVGITRQRDGLTYDAVDFGANLNLLRSAEKAGVRRFVYVSVVGAESTTTVPVLRAKRRFEKTLIESRLEWQIVRPSGFFTDMRDVWKMANGGSVHLFGDGKSRISPIDPADLAEVIADLLEVEPGQINSVGGPADFSWNEIAALAGRIAQKKCRIRHWPTWLLRTTLAVTRVVSSRTYGTLSFLGRVMTHDTTAPNHGTRSLEGFFRAQWEAEKP